MSYYLIMSKQMQRIYAIDALRGLVILLMMLDHVRETFYLHRQVSDPMNIYDTEGGLFFSRILAHLCAPVFVFLTGLSAYLYQQKNNSLAMTREFLLKRGLFLIVLELTVINFAWTAQFPPDVVYLQVIWAIGLSMVILAALIGLPTPVLWLISLLIIFGHNLLDQFSFSNTPVINTLWLIIHERGWIQFGDLIQFRSSYPILPWIGVISLGYCMAQHIFNPAISAHYRNTLLLRYAFSALAIFFVLRYFNMYGDQPRVVGAAEWQESLMSFFNLTKYPPSLLFLLSTLGVGLICLAILEKCETQKWLRPLIVFGSVPMFFYIVHLLVLKALYSVALYSFGTNYASYFGVENVSSLWLISILLSIALYPLMLRFSKFKHSHKHITILKYF